MRTDAALTKTADAASAFGGALPPWFPPRQQNRDRRSGKDFSTLGRRHYDPTVGRFLEPDSARWLDPKRFGGINPYVYCLNDPITKEDPSGLFVLSSFLIGLGVMAGIGALIGGASYTVSEGISYAITHEWSWSWGQFCGSVIGGALGGALAFISPGAPAALLGGLTGFSSNAFGMKLQNLWEGTNYSDGQIFFSSLISGLLASEATALSSKIRVPGLNSGRGSYLSVSKQIITKFRKGTISRITLNTFSKILTLNLVESLADGVVNGVTDAFGFNDSLPPLWHGAAAW